MVKTVKPVRGVKRKWGNVKVDGGLNVVGNAKMVKSVRSPQRQYAALLFQNR